MKAIIVGGGPVGCLTAMELRKRSFEVCIFERGADPREAGPGRGHSFNLTLTLRGLRTLEKDLLDSLYAQGVPLIQRVVHRADGGTSYQPYGTQPAHHLLSIPRGILHRTLLDEAERWGAQVFFNHECIRADPRRAHVLFMADGALREETGDLLVGCDGANSVIRQEMSRTGGRLTISQEFIEHGYVELRMPPLAKGEHALMNSLRDDAVPASAHHGLHVWPRGDFMLIAQPNTDGSYTTTLFMPLSASHPAKPHLQQLKTPEKVQAFFQHYFPDAVRFLPQLQEDFFAGPPSSLRIVKCHPYHFGRTVLIGDSAHTMVPFFGQGINCSFEDVRAFLSLLDHNRLGVASPDVIARTLSDFTQERTGPGEAISELSFQNLRELSAHADEQSFHARSHIERELHRRYPHEFSPLYFNVAFSSVPYDKARGRHERERQLLDELCRAFDVTTDAEHIIETYHARATQTALATPCPISRLEQSPRFGQEG